MINSFSGEHAFLSNFACVRVVMDEVTYPSVDLAYQAAKTDNLAARMRIRAARSAARAKALGNAVKLRENWNSVKLEVMLDLVRQKFTHKVFREQLLTTGNQPLVEGNHWGDTFWGVCRGKDKNTIVFPKSKISMQAGYFLRNGDSVWLVPNTNANFTINGKKITKKTLIFSNPEEMVMVSSGSLQFNIIKRSEKVGIRLRDLQSRNLTHFKGIDYFSTDSTWKIKAQFIKPAFKQNIIIKNALGQENPTELAGKIRFEYKGSFYTLDAISEGEYLLVVMR